MRIAINYLFILHICQLKSDYIEQYQRICQVTSCKNNYLEKNICEDENICIGPDFPIRKLLTCKSLKIINIEDGIYNCSEDWLHAFEQLAINVEFIYSNNTTRCIKNTAYCKRYEDFIPQMICQKIIEPYCKTSACGCFLTPFDIVSCPTKLLLHATLPYNIVANCSQRNLTSSTVPLSYPPKTTRLQLDMNQISDLTKLMVVVYELSHLSILDLSNNFINKFPLLPEPPRHLMHLKILHLQNNLIHKIESDILRSYINYPYLEVYLHGNPFQCDCETQEFMKLIKYDGKTFQNVDFVYCTFGKKLKRPWTMDYTNCKKDKNYFSLINFLILLAVIANVLAIYILIDMHRTKKDFQQGKEIRNIPVIGQICCTVGTPFCNSQRQQSVKTFQRSISKYEQRERLASLLHHSRRPTRGCPSLTEHQIIPYSHLSLK